MNDINSITTDDFFTSDWLKADDLPAGGAIVKIKAVTIEQVKDFDDPTQKRDTLILAFEDSDQKLSVNKTRMKSLVAITGSKRPIEWVGTEVVLQRGTAPNGKSTIIITPAARPTKGLKPAQAVEEIVFPVVNS